jgi:hypothetical protein
MAGVLGSLVGCSATVAATWVTQRTVSKRELIRTEIRRRETLYGEFISECSARIIDSFERTLEKPETLLQAYALLNRIRLCASDAVLAQAEAALRLITEQYFSPNLSVDEMRELVQKWTTDPLEPFGEACRLELKSMRAAV